MSNFAVSAVPGAVIPPEPAIEKLALAERAGWPISMSPEPAISPAKRSPSTLSIRMSPEPAIAAPRSAGAVTWTVTGPWSVRQPSDQLPFLCRS